MRALRPNSPVAQIKFFEYCYRENLWERNELLEKKETQIQKEISVLLLDIESKKVALNKLMNATSVSSNTYFRKDMLEVKAS